MEPITCPNCDKPFPENEGENGTPKFFIGIPIQRVCKKCFELISNDGPYKYIDAYMHFDKFPKVYTDKREIERIKKCYLKSAEECGQGNDIPVQ